METKKEVKFADLDSIEGHSNSAFEHEDENVPKSKLNASFKKPCFFKSFLFLLKANKSKRNTVFLLDPLGMLTRRKSSAKTANNELPLSTRNRRLSKSK